MAGGQSESDQDSRHHSQSIEAKTSPATAIPLQLLEVTATNGWPETPIVTYWPARTSQFLALNTSIVVFISWSMTLVLSAAAMSLSVSNTAMSFVAKHWRISTAATGVASRPNEATRITTRPAWGLLASGREGPR